MESVNKIFWGTALLCSLYASHGWSAEALTQDGGKVTAVIADGTTGMGGCAVSLGNGVDYPSLGLNCPNYIISFDCAGTSGLNTKSQALAMFNTAQLAFVADKIIRVRLQDVKKADGWCIATNVGVK